MPSLGNIRTKLVLVVVWAGTRVDVVLSQEGVGHALPSSNIFDDLLLGIKSSILPTLYPLQLLTPNSYHSLTNQKPGKSDQKDSLAKQLKK